MSLFGPIFEKKSFHDTGTLTDYDDFWYSLTGATSSSGQQVNSTTAMKYWAYYACVSLIAQSIGCFPLNLKRKVGKNSVDAIDEPLYWLMHDSPTKNWTSFYWREFGQTAQFNQGNDYSWIVRSRLGIKEIKPMDPWQTEALEAKGGERIRGRRILKTGEKYFRSVDEGGGTIYLLQEDVLHAPGFGYNGIKGVSFLTHYARDVVGRGISQNDFASKWFKNGIFTSGVFEHPHNMGNKLSAWKEAVRARFGGTHNTGIPMTLEDGMTWKPHDLSLVDQQFLEQEKETALQICGMMHVPPHKISIPTTHQAKNNTEEMNKHFLDTTMLPHVRKREDIYNTQLLTLQQRKEGFFFKFNYDHFLRPDAKARAEIAEIRQRMGVPLNRYLEKEDEQSTQHGDTEFISQNLTTAEGKIKEAEKAGEPEPEPQQPDPEPDEDEDDDDE
jgi:HK97 family phage portal protein